MTVLLVDDQISILSGLISGVNWDALGVTGIRTADSAARAREILLKEPIDILLCDIEMPNENGLSLLRWARRQGMDFVCVFLTSHADFLYAKEAMQLNCFDYILQPARYDEIQATIAKAITRVKDSHSEKELEQYGTVAKSYAAGLFQSLFSDWSAGQSLSIPALQAALRHFDQKLSLKDDCFIIWGHLLHWHTEPWTTQEWVYALNNIITELYETGGYGILSFSIDYTSLGWFIYAPSGHFPKPERILSPLHDAYLAVAEHLPCDFAFYTTPTVPLEQINAQSALLLSAKQNNILHESGIFCPEPPSDRFHVIKFLDITQLSRWENLLSGGSGDFVYAEARRYLDAMTKKGEMNRDALRSFWIQFQQTVLGAARIQGRNPQELLPLLESGNKAQSLQEMDAAIRRVTACFVQGDQLAESEKGIVERVKKYIEEHLDRLLNVSDIASSLFMNADYLSRLFKNESGISLKEYITKRKVESAQLLLRTTSLPVSVIAAKLGYDNFSHFSQVYRRATGLSPTDERKEK